LSLTSFAITLIDRLGVGGIGIGVFLNGLGVPGLSEIFLPLGGVGVAHGSINIIGLVIVAFIAQMLGLTTAYMIARNGGVTLIERYGKFILISHRELHASQRAFDKYGMWLVVFGAFIPGVQGFIGYVAGIAEMPYRRFLVAAFLGKVVWIGGLIYLGIILGDHLYLIDRSIKQTGVVVLALLIILAIWHIYRYHRKEAAIYEN
jgi:membrane protein DedA with SNARE-associated domain